MTKQRRDVWVTAQQVAGVLGAPKHREHVPRWAERQGIRRRKRDARIYEYRLHDMPSETRIALAPHIYMVSKRTPKQLTPVRNARLQVLAALVTWEDAHGGAKEECHRAFCQAYAAEQVPGLETQVYSVVRHVSSRTLRRWRKTLRDSHPDKLDSRRRRQPPLSSRPEIVEVVQAMMYRGEHTAANIHRTLLARFSQDTPSLRSIQYYIAHWTKHGGQVPLYITSPETWKSRRQTAFGRADAGVKRLNDTWELDSTITDIALRTPDGVKRYAIVGVLDVWSRRAKFQLAETSSATAILRLMRRTILDWGVPYKIRLDNGKDYASHKVGLLAGALKISILRCQPFRPEQKPFVERIFRTLSISMEQLPGYVGHSVAEQQAIRARKNVPSRTGQPSLSRREVEMTPGEFQAWLDNWAANDYGHRRHSELNASPFEKANSWRGICRRIDDERVLDLMLEPVEGKEGVRSISKRGISVDRRWYIAPELAAHIGERVRCYHDPDSPARLCVYLRDEWLCWAEDSEGADSQTIARAAKKRQREDLRAGLDDLRSKADRVKPETGWQEVASAAHEIGRKVLPMPTAAKTHETPALEAATDAVRARDKLDNGQKPPKALDAATQAHIDSLRAEGSPDSLARPAIWRSDQHRYHWCHTCHIRGETSRLAQKDREFIARYEAKYGITAEDSLAA